MKRILLDMMENIETLTRKFQILMHVYLNNSNSSTKLDRHFFKHDNELTGLIHYQYKLSAQYQYIFLLLEITLTGSLYIVIQYQRLIWK